MPDYEYFDHTADIGMMAYGDTLARMFQNAAKGMVGIMFDVGEGGKERTLTVSLEHEDNTEQLLIDWLNELLFLIETEGLVMTRFEISEITGKALKAKVTGTPMDPKVHRYKTEIKSTTYHMLKIGRENDKYFGRILFDI